MTRRRPQAPPLRFPDSSSRPLAASDEPSPSEWPRWLSLSQAARYCPLSKNTLARYVKDGLIEGKIVGNKYILDRYRLDEFLGGTTAFEDAMVRSILGARR